MTTTIRLVVLTIMLTQFNIAFADEVAYFGDRNPAAETCFEQTTLAAQGGDAATLSVTACNKALRSGSHSREYRSAVYHNRALIELALGQPKVARESLEIAVDLAPKVGLQHLSLAQLAFRQGDYHHASALYDALLSVDNAHPLIASNRELLQRNRDQIAQMSALASISIK
ncbi:MAG: hypothetical protein V7720_06920 [Halioglobus sp.]